jgi:hypothetical protein
MTSSRPGRKTETAHKESAVKRQIVATDKQLDAPARELCGLKEEETKIA